MKTSLPLSLARLSFWVPANRLSDFEAAYESRLAPILKKHGLVESAERGRPTATGVFSRLFEVEGPGEVAARQKALQEDPEFKPVLQALGAAFGTAQPEGGIQYSFEVYRVPAGPGKVVPAGPGKQVAAGPGKGQWRTFDATDGLASGGRYWSILQDREGHLWFGSEGGAIRYDGQQFVAFTTADGLAENWVRTILQDREGHLWFGTGRSGVEGNGVSRYDGQVFQTLARQDGLAGNVVYAIGQDEEGALWFGTNHGVTRYRSPAPSSPKVFADAVVADRRYEGMAEVEIPAVVRLIAFEFHAMSFKTRPEAMVYRYRLEGYEEEWQNTHSQRVEYQDLSLGEYTFQVRAVDRDLNYSESAEVHLKVVPDPRDQKIDELEQRVRERTRELEEANSALSDANKELFRTLQEKEKAQEALVRSESMAAIGTLVAGVAHELNNPLGAASSLVQTVQEMVEEDTAEQLQQEKAEIAEHLAFSRKELNRAKEIVASLLGLSRQNQDYTEAVDLKTVAQDALRVLYNQYKKYKVNITEEYIVLKTYREGGQVVFECADTGPGIPEEVRQDIFKPFFTTKAPGEGTGLGLYICHQTVEKHGGKIEVDSEVGKGTRFRVRLPAR